MIIFFFLFFLFYILFYFLFFFNFLFFFFFFFYFIFYFNFYFFLLLYFFIPGINATTDDKIPNVEKIKQHLKKEELYRLTFGSSPSNNATNDELIIGPNNYIIYRLKY